MKESLNLQKEPLFDKQNKPLIVSGPCSAESEEQVISTAMELSMNGVDVFRAGIWKPRTRPGGFEGMGSVALPWLRRVKEETGMLTATEVANVWHIREALKYDTDILWIGARTTANPFAIQELAEALRGIDIPVFVKNPVNPDIELWVGALERLNKAGITRLAAVHRGFSHYGESPYRNMPQWEIPVELKRRFPELPVITDPSHICGNRELLFSVAQTAMDLDFDGLFIESHIDPDSALSDKNQQLTPADLKHLLDKLVCRQSNALETEGTEILLELRRQIDSWDEELLRIVKSRMSVSEKIGEYKKRQNITILQTSRWADLLEERLSKSRSMGLSDSFIIELFRQIHQESINFQNRVMN
jgi:chorismate mutase